MKTKTRPLALAAVLSLASGIVAASPTLGTGAGLGGAVTGSDYSTFWNGAKNAEVHTGVDNSSFNDLMVKLTLPELPAPSSGLGGQATPAPGVIVAVENPAAVPEPGTVSIVLAGLGLLAAAARRKGAGKHSR